MTVPPVAVPPASDIFQQPIVTSEQDTLLSQGAEARIWLSRYLGQEVVLKQRFSKGYRHSVLDRKLTTSRLKQEVRAILRARKLGVLTPVVLNVELEASTIYFQRIVGQQLKTALLSDALSLPDLRRVLAEVGRAVALLHDGDIVHGELTTSNLLLTAAGNRLVVIDFGLSYNTNLPEDKAVDLYVLERAFAVHQRADDLVHFDDVLKAYKAHSRSQATTLKRLQDVRMRGRKRTMVG